MIPATCNITNQRRTGIVYDSYIFIKIEALDEGSEVQYVHDSPLVI